MEIGSSWAWSFAAFAAIAALLRAAVLGERRMARHWPDLHARWSRYWALRHALAAAMAAVGLALFWLAHGAPDGPVAFALSVAWGAAAAALVYLGQWLLLALLACAFPLLLPEILSAARYIWRHRRDPVPQASDWLPPGSARLGVPTAPEREP